MNEFKVGDIIKGKINGYTITNEKMFKAEVLKVKNGSMDIKVLDHEIKEKIGQTYPAENDIRSFDYYKPTLENIFSLPIGSKIITDKGEHNVFIKVRENDWCNDNLYLLNKLCLNEDLSIKDSFFGNKIIKIEKATYEVFYEKNEKEEIKEMTVADIENALGYPVKIIKE